MSNAAKLNFLSGVSKTENKGVRRDLTQAGKKSLAVLFIFNLCRPISSNEVWGSEMCIKKNHYYPLHPICRNMKIYFFQGGSYYFPLLQDMIFCYGCKQGGNGLFLAPTIVGNELHYNIYTQEVAFLFF